MDLNRVMLGWQAATGPEIVQAATLRAVAAELRRLQDMEARAKGVRDRIAAEGEYTDGARSAARIILGESGAPTAPDREPPA